MSPTGSSADWSVSLAQNGSPTVILNGKPLHSRFNPEKEAARTASMVPETASIVVLAGFGLGYVAEALVEKRPGRLLVVAESDPDIMERSLETRNTRPLFQRPEVSLICGGDPQLVRDHLVGGPTGAEIFFLPWRPALDQNPSWYGRLAEAVRDTAARKMVNAQTLEKFARLWVRNLAKNALVMPEALSLATIVDRFLGVPALVVAGGPSLDQFLPHFPEYRKRCLVIVVDTALRAVMRSGIDADVVAAVDPQYWNGRHLDRLESKALVLAESATHPAVFRQLKGRPILSRTKFPMGTVLEDAAGIDGTLKAGGSVTTAAWDFARRMGCSPLYAVGLDLAYPGGKSHYDGSLARELPHKSSTRLNPASTPLWEALHTTSRVQVASANGSMVWTDRRMDVYARWFSEQSQNDVNRRFLLGGEGRALNGFGVADSEDLLSLPIQRNRIDRILQEIQPLKSDPQSRERVEQALAQVGRSMDELRSLARAGEQITRQIQENLKRGRSPTPLLNDLNNIDEKLLSTPGREVVSFLLQPLITQLESGAKQNPEEALAASLTLYQQLAESANYHRRYLPT